MTAAATAAAPPVLVRGGSVADGVGDALRRVDVRVRDGRVHEVAAGLRPSPDDVVVDADGLVVLPGFVDAHSHAGAAVLDADVQRALLAQGVTSLVLGQDGLSPAPSRPPDGGAPDVAHDPRPFVERYFAAVDGTHPTFRGGGVDALLATWAHLPLRTHYLVPHGTLRYAVLGAEDRPARPDEVAAMVRLLEAGLDAGAVGMSTGLEYAPACWADRAELVALCRVLVRRGRPHVSHMRGYEDRAVAGMAELVDLAHETGVATHVSHYHGPADVLTGLVDDALAAGVDVTFDSYPYLRGASVLGLVVLPTWLPLADPDRTVALLADPDVRARLVTTDLAARADVWPRVTLSHVPAEGLRWAEGLPLVEVAARLGLPPGEAALHLLAATRLEAGAVFAQPPTNDADAVRALARHPAHCAGSDGIHVGGRPHPRGWGTFARWCAWMVRDTGDWDWPTAARHLSATAARRFGLPGGRLVPGAAGDVVVLDPDAVTDTATYADPRAPAVGVEHVLVAGRRVHPDPRPV